MPDKSEVSLRDYEDSKRRAARRIAIAFEDFYEETGVSIQEIGISFGGVRVTTTSEFRVVNLKITTNIDAKEIIDP